jgi:hypothetical protein
MKMREDEGRERIMKEQEGVGRRRRKESKKESNQLL